MFIISTPVIMIFRTRASRWSTSHIQLRPIPFYGQHGVFRVLDLSISNTFQSVLDLCTSQRDSVLTHPLLAIVFESSSLKKAFNARRIVRIWHKIRSLRLSATLLVPFHSMSYTSRVDHNCTTALFPPPVAQCVTRPFPGL